MSWKDKIPGFSSESEGNGGDWLPDMSGSAEAPEDTGPDAEDLQERIDELQEERDQLREKLQQEDDERSARLAQLEERIQELEQDKKELQEQAQQAQQKVQEVQETQQQGAVQTPAPDTQHLQGKPVVSRDGNKFWGLFDAWINERGKIGIKAVDPHNRGVAQKVGWADSINDLVVRPNSLRDKDIIICKLDENMEMTDLAPMSRFQEVLQEKERLEDKAQRLSSENDELIRKKQKKEKLINKLLVSLSVERMRGATGDGADKDMVLNKQLSEREMLQQRMDTQREKLQHERQRQSDLVDEYEQQREELLGKIGQDDRDQIIEEYRNMMKGGTAAFSDVLEQLSEEQQQALLGGSGGGEDLFPGDGVPEEGGEQQ